MSSAEHFEGLLNTTIKRLENLCNEWQKCLNEEDSVNKKCPPDDVACEIMSALGKTNLLLNSKLPQFRHLVEELSRGQYGERPIKPADLQGFWDLISLEINDVDRQFDKLCKRKELDWAVLPEETIEAETTRVKSTRSNGDRLDGTGKSVKNFDHLRSAAKSRLALAKAKMQEAMQQSMNETKDDGNENGVQKCTMKDRDLSRVSIC